jgi:hypothetical protein
VHSFPLHAASRARSNAMSTTPIDHPAYDDAFNRFMETASQPEANQLFTRIYLAYTDYVFGTVTKRFHESITREQLKTIVHDAFTRLFEKRVKDASFRIDPAQGHVGTYLVRTAWNLCLKAVTGKEVPLDAAVDVADPPEEDRSETAGIIARYKLLFMRFLADEAIVYDDLFLFSGKHMHDVEYQILARKVFITNVNARVRTSRFTTKLRNYLLAQGLHYGREATHR